MSQHSRHFARIARSLGGLAWTALGILACSSEPAASPSAGGKAGNNEPGTAGRRAEPSSGGAGEASGGAGEVSGGAGRDGRAGAASGGSGGAGGSGASATRGGAAGAGAGRAAVSAGEGGADHGGGTGRAACAGHDWLLCEDFEATALGAVPSAWTRHGELAAVDDSDAHGGSRALKLGPAANAERRIYHDAKLLGSAHWGRIFFKVQTPVPDAFVHSTLVSLIGNGPKNGRSEYRPIDTVKQAKDTRDVGGRHNFLYNVQIIGKTEFGTETNYDYVFDANWHCVEYHLDAADQSYTLYFDGKDVLNFSRGAGNYDASDIPTEFDELRVGWINYQSAPPGFTAFIDDIAFDDERVGCE